MARKRVPHWKATWDKKYDRKTGRYYTITKHHYKKNRSCLAKILTGGALLLIALIVTLVLVF